MSLRVLVVDDTIVFRTIVADVLSSIPDVEVVGMASNGKVALSRIEELKPDLVTLDIEMPGMNGIQVLEEMRKKGASAGVLIVSSQSAEDGTHTIKALEAGAFDFITKPDEGSAEKNKLVLRDSLVSKVKAFARKREIRSILNGGAVWPSTSPVNKTEKGVKKTVYQTSQRIKPEIVLIGVSTGGPAALNTVVPAIPGDLNAPLLIVQHMPPMFTQALAESLDKKSKIRVVEAANGMIPEAGIAYIAPGGKQMKLVKGIGGQKIIIITDDPPENNCKPSVDYLFRSVSINFPFSSVAVIMTGMGSDGTIGLQLLKRQGCYVFAQSEESCVVYGMPKAAVEAGAVDEIVNLDQIAIKITGAVRKGLL
jgi:two-component system chemotaxis response regulator CheB